MSVSPLAIGAGLSLISAFFLTRAIINLRNERRSLGKLVFWKAHVIYLCLWPFCLVFGLSILYFAL
jgi:hypothetical protein